ncbi:putative peptidoglycan-associated lipoprotein [Candidatus Terasakiella magnetica]|nr:putative peptidoglycan-associated lipoprotein [Candidatus Terasakiella magnetica]
MDDTRRDFLLRFAATALAVTGAASRSAAEDLPAHNAVYGVPPIAIEARTIVRIEGAIENFITDAGDRVFFGVNTVFLDDPAKAILIKQAEWLKQYDTYTLMVEGHADDPGTREDNLDLSMDRAAAIKAFLIANGVASTRIKSIFYGRERRAVEDGSDSAKAQNRRGVTVLDRIR